MIQRSTIRSSAIAIVLAASCFANAQYGVHKLVSDGYTWAPQIDKNLVNPWGISESGASPFWVSNNGTGTSSLYNSTGGIIPLVVTVPGSPTGQVFNGSKDFVVSSGGQSAASRFIFASEDGTISGWNFGVSATNASVIISRPNAVYKGLGIGAVAGKNYLYAANFSAGTVDMFDGTNSYVGSFTDSTVPAGYVPFNVQNLGGTLYVTYALSSGGHDETHGPGLGLVDKFDQSGNFLGRVGTGGPLDAPWGVAIAPSTFGQFRGDLLVGNFGDGTINAYDLLTNTYMGTLADKMNNPLVIDGLWGLQFGNGVKGGHLGDFYFTAGAQREAHGLFGEISTVPAPSALLVMGLGLLTRVRRRRA